MGLDNEQIYEIEFLQPSVKLEEPLDDDEEVKEYEENAAHAHSNFKFLLARSDLDLLIYRGIQQGVFTKLQDVE